MAANFGLLTSFTITSATALSSSSSLICFLKSHLCPCAAGRTFYNTGQQMNFGILAPVDVFVFLRLYQQFDLCLVP